MGNHRRDNQGCVLRTGESQDCSTGRYHFKIMRKGRRYTVSAGSLKELRQREEALLMDVRDEIHTPAAKRVTLNSCFEQYMHSKTNLRDTSRALYLRLWDYHVRDTIGCLSLAELSASTIRKFYANCLIGEPAVREKPQGISISTVRLLHGMIYPSLELAMDDNLIRRNPANRALKNITGAVRKRKALTVSQQDAFLAFLHNSKTWSRYEPVFTFALSTGLRSGELTGLQWSDIDQSAGTVNVNKQLLYRKINGEGHRFFMAPLKTAAARRTIPLTQAARQALAQLKKPDAVPSPFSVCKSTAGYQDYVFRTEACTPFSVYGLNHALCRIVSAYNKTVPEDQQLPPLSMHILRHCFCSRCAENGMNPKTLQTLMGHVSIETTMNIYTDLDPVKIRDEMSRIENGIVQTSRI